MSYVPGPVWMSRIFSALGLLIVAGLGVIVAFWMADPVPVKSFGTLDVEIRTSVRDLPYLSLTREFCLDEAANAEVSHIFRHLPDPGGGGDREEVVESPPGRVELLAGCHRRSRSIDLPASFGPGRWLYSATLFFENKMRRKVPYHLPPVLLHVSYAEGRWSVGVQHIAPGDPLAADAAATLPKR